MSRQKYENKLDKTLTRLVDESTTMSDDDIIIKLTQTLETLGRDYASIR